MSLSSYEFFVAMSNFSRHLFQLSFILFIIISFPADICLSSRLITPTTTRVISKMMNSDGIANLLFFPLRQKRSLNGNERRVRQASSHDTSTHDSNSSQTGVGGEYYKEQLDLMEWLKGPVIIISIILVISLILFFFYIYKYKAQSGGRRESMAPTHMNQVVRNSALENAASP